MKIKLFQFFGKKILKTATCVTILQHAKKELPKIYPKWKMTFVVLNCYLCFVQPIKGCA